MPVATSDVLAKQIEMAIVLNPYFNHKKMQLKMNAGRVVLEGEVNTYFEKQMVQEALRNVHGVHAISNHLEVIWN